MNAIKFITATALLFTCYLQIYAQTKINGVWSEVQNQKIVVHYTLLTKQPANVNLQYSIDNGETWRDCISVTGDLVAQITGNKTIVWDCLQDGYEKGSLLFRIDAPEAVVPKVISFAKKNVFGADLGLSALKLDKWGTFLDVGVRYTYNFSHYIGWDVINPTIHVLLAAPAFDTSLLQVMTGLRVYAPTIDGYASLKVGYGYQTYWKASGGPTLELEMGIHLTKIVSVGLVGNIQQFERSDKFGDYDRLDYGRIGLCIGFNF